MKPARIDPAPVADDRLETPRVGALAGHRVRPGLANARLKGNDLEPILAGEALSQNGAVAAGVIGFEAE